MQYSAHLADDLRLIVVDSTIAGREGGYVDVARAAWVGHELASAATPTIVAMHHPPIVTGIAHMDALGFVGRDLLASSLRHADNVVCIIAGHLHRSIVGAFAGTGVVVCPSTAHQLVADLRPTAALRFTDGVGSFALHRWNGESVASHVVHVESLTQHRFHHDGQLIR